MRMRSRQVPAAAARSSLRRGAAVGRRRVSKPRSPGRPAGPSPSPSPRTAPCSSPSAATRGRVQLRLHRMFLHAPPAVVQALARSLRRTSRSADGEVRRFMNDNLHRVRRTRRGFPPLQSAGRAHDLRAVYARLNERFFGGPAARAHHLGTRRRARAPGRAHLRQLRPRARPHPHPPRARPPRGARSTSWRASSTTRCCTTTWAASPTARAAPSTTRGPSARRRCCYPWHREALAWEKENLPHLLRASQALDRERRAGASSLRARRPRGRRSRPDAR